MSKETFEPLALKILAQIVEKQDEIIMQTIQQIGGDKYIDITIDRHKVLEALADYVEKCRRAARKTMTYKQQIEEMALAICESRHVADVDDCRKCERHEDCLYQDIAYGLYNAGYRKQSEWISVDERLPHVSGKYICGVKEKNGNTWTVSADWILELKTWFGEFGEIKNIVTHWMPFPEPPKVDGGAE